MYKMKKIYQIFLLFYALLSFFKFFFAEIRTLGEAESGYLVLKYFPTYQNSFGGGEETIENIKSQKGSWHYKGEYIKTGLDYNNPWWVEYFLWIILLWFFLTPIVLIFLMIKLMIFMMNRRSRVIT